MQLGSGTSGGRASVTGCGSPCVAASRTSMGIDMMIGRSSRAARRLRVRVRQQPPGFVSCRRRCRARPRRQRGRAAGCRGALADVAPATRTSGVLLRAASVSAVSALVSPGPCVTAHTPILPPTRANASPSRRHFHGAPPRTHAIAVRGNGTTRRSPSPIKPNTVSTPAARAWAATRWERLTSLTFVIATRRAAPCLGGQTSHSRVSGRQDAQASLRLPRRH